MSFIDTQAARRTTENYIYTPSPYALQKPAEWFLDELFAYDPELRIFASLDQPLYRIMRRTRNSQPWTVFLKDKPDTAIAIRFGLYPVTSVNPSALAGFSWARVLLDLQERDQWKFRNAGDVVRQVEGADDAREQRIITEQLSEVDARAGDMYRAYKNMNGERVSLAYRTPDGVTRQSPSARAPRRAYRPQGAGAGAFFTGRQRGPIVSAVR